MTAPAFPRRRIARGFTLIEVLIAVLIFSVGILGAVGMQAKLQQATSQNGDRARASMLANDMASQMWAMQTADPSSTALSGPYGTWLNRVQTASGNGAVGLSNGVGLVSYNATTKTSTITITWREPNATSNSSFTTSVVIP
jgi:type IV pilus assembly protein PilV